MKDRLSSRNIQAKESFKNAADCIGPIEKGKRLFAITRGQWSMIDAVLHTLDCVGPSKLTLWTWTIAEYEVQTLTRLRTDARVTSATLVIDSGARVKNANLIREWKSTFGPKSVRYVLNHAKIATVESASGFKVCLRGSMNLNFNPRFEQFDLSEGGEDFDLVRQIESELPILGDDCTGAQVYAASKVSSAFSAEQLSLFSGVKVWAK